MGGSGGEAARNGHGRNGPSPSSASLLSPAPRGTSLVPHEPPPTASMGLGGIWVVCDPPPTLSLQASAPKGTSVSLLEQAFLKCSKALHTAVKPGEAAPTVKPQQVPRLPAC